MAARQSSRSTRSELDETTGTERLGIVKAEGERTLNVPAKQDNNGYRVSETWSMGSVFSAEAQGGRRDTRKEQVWRGGKRG